MQALEFVVVDTARLGHMEHACQCVCIVRGELRVDRIGGGEQAAGTHEIGEIRMLLSRINRVVAQTVNLSALDFAIPVGPLDQADHQPALRAAGQRDQGIDDGRTTFLISLDNEPESMPAGQIRIRCDDFEQIERQFEPVSFFGIYIEADIVLFCEQEQLLEARQQFAHHAPALATYIAGMQG